MCRLVSAFAAREKMVCFFFSAHLLLVSSADNLFKQLGPRSDPAKLSCKNGAHVKSRMSLRCWRGKSFFFFFFFSVHISVLQLPQLFYSTEFSCRNTLRLSAVSYQHSLLKRKVFLFFQRPSHSVRFFFVSSFLSTIIYSVLLK